MYKSLDLKGVFSTFQETVWSLFNAWFNEAVYIEGGTGRLPRRDVFHPGLSKLCENVTLTYWSDLKRSLNGAT